MCLLLIILSFTEYKIKRLLKQMMRKEHLLRCFAFKLNMLMPKVKNEHICYYEIIIKVYKILFLNNNTLKNARLITETAYI